MPTATKNCSDCKLREQTSLFELCKHPTSEYKDQFARVQWHSVGHMRSIGSCQAGGQYFHPL